jgi:hypothetical protein
MVWNPALQNCENIIAVTTLDKILISPNDRRIS